MCYPSLQFEKYSTSSTKHEHTVFYTEQKIVYRYSTGKRLLTNGGRNKSKLPYITPIHDVYNMCIKNNED